MVAVSPGDSVIVASFVFTESASVIDVSVHPVGMVCVIVYVPGSSSPLSFGVVWSVSWNVFPQLGVNVNDVGSDVGSVILSTIMCDLLSRLLNVMVAVSPGDSVIVASFVFTESAPVIDVSVHPVGMVSVIVYVAGSSSPLSFGVV